ncbi:MAG: D-amino acid dehydrogenase [Syntrophobacteraceae bacterium]|nr:D-amino acid dehydrogenase [Syntrophobacteraceae bacterium]
MAGNTTNYLRPNYSMPDALVLGAGITGVTTAYLLARAGLDVQVIDRGAEPALGTTYANGAQISASHAEPWAHPGAPRQVLEWLTEKDSPLYFSPRLDWRQWVWLIAWLRQCRKSAADRNTLEIMKIALRSRELYRQVREFEIIDYAQKSLGILHFYRKSGEFKNARRVAELMSANGCRRRAVTKEEIDSIEPALAQNRDIIGGIYTEDDESGDARLFTRALARVCEQKYRVRFLFGANIENLVSGGNQIHEAQITRADGSMDFIRANHFVLCLGPWSPFMAAKLSIFLNIYPAKGYSISTPLDKTTERHAPRVSLTDDENKIVYSNLETHLRVAGTAELAGWDLSLHYHRIRPLVEKAAKLFPGVFSNLDWRDPTRVLATLHPWTGLRPATPSNLPYVGKRTEFRNLWLNTGHGTLGWTMGMATAEMVAKMITGEIPAQMAA